MPRLFLLLILTSFLVAPGRAQSVPAQDDPSKAVRARIDALFDGMRAGDSTAVRSVFHSDARLHTALGPSDTTALESTPIDGFVAAVGQPHERVWDERVWDVEIRVDGPLASAWVPYVFYLGDERSHCGVNAMQFVHTEAGWKILQLIDTRRQECDVPAEVRKSE